MFLPKGRSRRRVPVTRNEEHQGDDGENDEDGPKHDGPIPRSGQFRNSKYEQGDVVVAPGEREYSLERILNPLGDVFSVLAPSTALVTSARNCSVSRCGVHARRLRHPCRTRRRRRGGAVLSDLRNERGRPYPEGSRACRSSSTAPSRTDVDWQRMPAARHRQLCARAGRVERGVDRGQERVDARVADGAIE